MSDSKKLWKVMLAALTALSLASPLVVHAQEDDDDATPATTPGQRPLPDRKAHV